jgi:hypothetical protein
MFVIAWESYVTQSLALFPLALGLKGWSYLLYAVIAMVLRKNTRTSIGPTLVAGIALLAVDMYACSLVVKGTSSTDAILLGLVPFYQVLFLLPLGLGCGWLVERVVRMPMATSGRARP